MADLLDRARTLSDDLTALRRDLHRHPELGFKETRTAGVVAARLRDLGIEVRTGVGITGVVGDLRNGPGPVVALRADMDALPIQEAGEHAYCSTVPGVMHACGHDAHVAGLVGAATLLVAERAAGRLPPGTVRFLFQPSEEGVDEEGKSGATRMLDDGALDGVSVALGLHVGSHLTAGVVLLADGPVMGGGEEIRVTVRGRSAHAAFPHEGIDALTLAAEGVIATQVAVARRLPPTEPGVVTFGRIEGGVAANVVADEVRLRGTLRYFSEAARAGLRGAVEDSFAALEAGGAQVDVEFRPGYPPLVNDPSATASVRRAFSELLGEAHLAPQPPVLASEDFAFFALRVPAVFVWLGAALPEPRQHHHPRFDIDEGVLPVGAAVLTRGAAALLEAHVG